MDLPIMREEEEGEGGVRGMKRQIPWGANYRSNGVGNVRSKGTEGKREEGTNIHG
jgi:hypothetical protein